MKIRVFTILGAAKKSIQSRMNMMSREKLTKFLTENPEYILDLKDPDRELRQLCLRESPGLIENLPGATEEDYLDAVREDGLLIAKIKNPTRKILIEALKQNGEAIEFIEDQTPEFCKLAIVADPMAIKHIKKQTKELQLLAARMDGLAIQHMDNPPEEVQIASVKSHPSAIGLIERPTNKALETAIISNGLSIEYVTDPSEALQLLAIENSDEAQALRYIEKPTPKVQREAYFKNKKLLPYLPNPPEDVQIDAVLADPLNIQWVEKPGPEVQKLLIKVLTTEPDILDFVEVVEPEVMDAYKKIITFSEKTDRHKSIIPNDAYLNPTQIKLFRYMDQRHVTKITTHELKKFDWLDEKILKRLLKQAKDGEIGKENVLKIYFDLDQSSPLSECIITESEFGKRKWEEDEGTIFEKENNVFIIYLDPEKLEEYNVPESIITILEEQVEKLEPPYLSHLLTVSYVRYTLFKQDVWIDEVSTKLLDLLPPKDRKAMFWIYNWTVTNFIREMRYRDYQKFYYPSQDLRIKLYDLKPDLIADAIPKDNLFENAIIKNIDPLVNGKETFVLASA